MDVLERYEEELARLNNVYVETRYPDVGSHDYTDTEAEDDIRDAEEILPWLDEKTSEE